MLCGAASFGVPALLSKQGVPASSPVDEIEPSERRAMAEVAEDYRRKFDAPGLSVAIAREGRLAYAQAFGVTGHGSRKELTTSNLFRIASVSKPITSAAIFHLIEEGRLRLDDTVIGRSGVLGTQYGRKPYGQGIEQITIDHLLTHTSGDWDLWHDPMFSKPEMDQAELISWALDTLPLKNTPGKVFAYSNFGYCLLGRVIEKITGQPYSTYVQKTVLLPSGITEMRIGGNRVKDRVPGEVTYYQQTLAEGENHNDDPYALNVKRMDSHGGWIATPTDLVCFATHVDGFEASRNILKTEIIRRMTTPSEANPNYARGWHVNAEGHWWHGGDLGGTSAVLVRTASRFCWAALTNTRRNSSQEALDDMVWEMARKVSAWQAALG
ncbi:MAG: penicillin-binding protein [Candidatus Acidoferrum typicum]|nr:penicillin-binding protein [Candidatus Acidoferrum typicum]